MYRDIVHVAKSLYRVSMVHTFLRLVYVAGKLSGRLTKMAIETMDYDGSDFCVRLDSDLTYGVLVSAVASRSYLDMRRRGFDVRALRYEDLVAHPLDMCRIILEFCRLPVLLAELAVKALDVDSQKDCIAAKSIIKLIKEPQVTLHTKANLNELLKQFGMPLIGEPGILEGTFAV